MLHIDKEVIFLNVNIEFLTENEQLNIFNKFYMLFYYQLFTDKSIIVSVVLNFSY